MWVVCPYCDLDVDIDDSNLVDLGSDNYLEDCECDNCGREFDVYVEFEPRGSGEEIVYKNCECCSREYKTRHLYQRGRILPFPKEDKYSTLCSSCYSKLMNEEWEEVKGGLI